MKSPCFNIVPVVNKKIESFLLKTQKELNGTYEVSFSLLPKIFLIGSRKELDNIRGGEKTPDWLVAWTGNEEIYILDPKIYEKESCHKGDFWQVLKHEYCHIYHHRITEGNSYPHWLVEGTACYFARQMKCSPSKKQALAIFSDPDPDNVYNVGCFWTEVLVKEFGKKKLIGFIKRIERDMTPKDFLVLFKKHFKILSPEIWGEKMVLKYLRA